MPCTKFEVFLQAFCEHEARTGSVDPVLFSLFFFVVATSLTVTGYMVIGVVPAHQVGLRSATEKNYFVAQAVYF